MAVWRQNPQTGTVAGYASDTYEAAEAHNRVPHDTPLWPLTQYTSPVAWRRQRRPLTVRFLNRMNEIKLCRYVFVFSFLPSTVWHRLYEAHIRHSPYHPYTPLTQRAGFDTTSRLRRSATVIIQRSATFFAVEIYHPHFFLLTAIKPWGSGIIPCPLGPPVIPYRAETGSLSRHSLNNIKLIW